MHLRVGPDVLSVNGAERRRYRPSASGEGDVRLTPPSGSRLSVAGVLRALLLGILLVTTTRCSIPMAMPDRAVVTTTSVLADLAARVAGERATVESLVPPGVPVEDFVPTPSDVIATMLLMISSAIISPKPAINLI